MKENNIMNKIIPIIIPAYEPDDRLIALIHNLAVSMEPIIIVDDGSGAEYASIFEQCKHILNGKGVILTHECNKGKGRALKTAFSFVLEHYKKAIGVVTADSDGQHNAIAIDSVKKALQSNPESLILGVRSFDGEGIPWKSVFGNKLTIKILSYVSGIKISDTQTGLRGIPKEFARKLLEVKGERFEFETEMLVESSGKFPIIEVPIETIYDSEENHQTHFNPIVDSIKIYRVFGKIFLKYVFSSVSPCFFDLLLFVVFSHFFREKNYQFYIVIATVLSRIISAIYNYAINYKFVFYRSETIKKSVFRYSILAIVQMSLSAFLVTIGASILPLGSEVIIKIVVDSILFFASYHMQQKHVF